MLLASTAVASFVTTPTPTGAGSFPDLVAGLWILHRNTATTGIGLGYVTLSPGNVVRAYQDGSPTLISNQTQTYTGGEAPRHWARANGARMARPGDRKR